MEKTKSLINTLERLGKKIDQRKITSMKDVKRMFYKNKEEYEGPNLKEIKRKYNEMQKSTSTNYQNFMSVYRFKSPS